MTRVLILLGPPGAGKGTQAARLSQAVSLPHVATGDLFRLHLREETPLGLKAKEYMNSGRLVPDDLVIEMLFDRVSQADCSEGFLLDGFPRTEAQAEALEERLPSLAGAGALEVQVGNLAVDDEVLVERASGRLLCRSCGNIHHRSFLPPRKEGVCDADGGELYRRDDDAPEVVRERLGVYEKQTRPVIEFYRQRGLLTEVDGAGSMDDVFESLIQVFDSEHRQRGSA